MSWWAMIEPLLYVGVVGVGAMFLCWVVLSLWGERAL